MAKKYIFYNNLVLNCYTFHKEPEFDKNGKLS